MSREDEPFWVRAEDQVYTLRTVLPGYGGWKTGVTADGFQVLRCPPTRLSAVEIEFVFGPNGDLLDSDSPPQWTWDESPIHVRRFWDETAAIGVSDLPDVWVKYWTEPNPALYEFERGVCREWLAAGRFEFILGGQGKSLQADGNVWRP